MSLVIYVSTKSVIISKYQLEFPFKPPSKNLTKAAIGAYQLLRRSEAIQITSSRDEREEAMTLLRHYGYALFQSLIPDSYRSRINRAGGLFVFSLDRDIINLPWELLFDGSSFFALTQGVVRINASSSESPVSVLRKEQPFLNVSLNSHSPLKRISPGNRFISCVEELVSDGMAQSPLARFRIDGNAARRSILDSLKENPDIFFFSGHDSTNGWLLSDHLEQSLNGSWFRTEFQPAFADAVKNGLRVFILSTSTLLKSFSSSEADPLTRYFDLGVPYIVSVHGRIARYRFQEYFQNFILGLLREENILRAHRYAINSIFSSLTLSWDWSWIQLHVNQKLLERSAESPLPPFMFQRDLEVTENGPVTTNNSFLNYRRFSGNSEILDQLTYSLVSSARDEIIHLQTSDGMMLEEYLQEFLRRLSSNRTFRLSVLYYQRWGFHGEQKERLSTTRYGKLFSFLLERENIVRQFEQSLIDLSSLKGENGDLKFLVVYYPPERVDSALDSWLKQKQKAGWKIVFLSDDSHCTRLPSTRISTDKTSSVEITDAFEDELPEPWLDMMVDPLPPQMRNSRLLKIAASFGDLQIIEQFQREYNSKVLWKKTFQGILKSLSSQRTKLVMALFLLRVKCSKRYLAKLLSIKKIDPDLGFLHQLHLIDTNLSNSHFWISPHLHFQITRYELIPGKQLLTFGQELLQRQIIALHRHRSPSQYKICGFQYSISVLAKLGSIENPLQRNLQFGKKLSRYLLNSPLMFYSNIGTSLELALMSKQKHLILKTVFSVTSIMENLPMEAQTVRIYEWLLKNEEKHRNWSLVSEILMKLAAIFARLDRKEKAIGLIASAIQLNNDIKNYSSRFQNLITIGLLLLDLGELEKVRKLISNADFDLDLLNEGDIVRLWLIDGHMLFYEKKYNDAANSFSKVVGLSKPPVPDSLLAKTYANLGEIYLHCKDMDGYGKCLNKASEFFERAGNLKSAFEHHEKSSTLYLSSGKALEAISHLEWLYNSLKQSGDPIRVRDIADQLGGLYYKAGDKIKSTSYYSIAQGIQI
ncbi:MAG: hypothetical protein GY866_09550 [Proteobacteria bacterium]|nr:hypothetical protein [Pseudomonadota bacterium]